MAEQAPAITIDVPVVLARLNALHTHLAANAPLWGGASALQLSHGKRAEGPSEPMVVTLQILLLGYEFPDTISVLTAGELLVHGSQKKLDYLKVVADASAGGPVRVRLLPREKGDASVPANRDALDKLLAAVARAGNRLATFPTDPTDGPVALGWKTELDAAAVTCEDGLRGAEAFLAVKDDQAQAEVRAAGRLAARVLRSVALPDMESVIDEERRVSNQQLAADVGATVEDRAKLEKRKVPVDTDNYDVAMPLLVQSGGQYNIAVLTPGLASTDRPLSYDVIVMSLAMRYKGMRAVCARTYLIDPTPKMMAVYDAVESAQAQLIALLRPGAVIGTVCVAVRDQLMQAGLPLTAKLGRNFGSGVGARVSDRHLQLSPKNMTVVEAGMCFAVSVCMTDIPREDSHAVAEAPVNKLVTYAIVLADTVVVDAAGPQVVTDKAPRERKQVSYEMAGTEEGEGEEDKEEEDNAAARSKAKAKKKGEAGTGAGAGASRRSGFDPAAGRDASGRSARLKELAKDIDPEAASKRQDHQAELVGKRQEQARRRLRSGGTGSGDEAADDLENAADIVGYGASSDYPKGARPNQIVVDRPRDCVLVPMLGMLVPFHISTIKSCVKQDEGHKSLLRINFYSAGLALGKDADASMQAAVQRHPDSVYVRSLNFMSKDPRNFVDVDRMIKAMLKAHRTQRKEEKETGGLVEQPRLVKRKEGVTPKVVDIHMWPSMSGRGRTQGTLSAHINGLGFESSKGERLEIIYANIKTAIFQPCENEHVVLIHFHLRHPILIGKKKYAEIQFFTEVVEASQELDKARRNYDDDDELQEEDRERQLRSRLNKAYKAFVQKVEDVAALDAGSQFRSFEVPSRDLAFQGSPFKEMTTVLLGASAIVAVVDKPPLVIAIEDIELVHFERVLQGGKSFDMVVVLKAGVADKGADEFVRISQIEMKHMENIQNWLNDVAEAVYTESGDALVWKLLIAEHVRDPHFWLEEDADGNTKNIGMGEVLQPFGDGAGGAGGSGEEEEESEEEEAYESSEQDDDDDDDDVSLASEHDDDDDDESEDDEDDGSESEADWDKQEAKAKASDKKRLREGGTDDDEERKGKSKKRK